MIKNEISEEIKKDRTLINDYLQEMRILVNDKLNSLKYNLPILFTLVTALLAFFMTQKINFNDESFKRTWFILILILMIIFASLILSYNVKAHYEKENSKSKIYFFEPWDITSYWAMSDSEFISELQKYFDCDLTPNEKFKALIIKEKINEFRVKKIILTIINSVIILFTTFLILYCLSMLLF